MAKVFVFDAARCSGCHNCQLACKDEHCENDWRPYAAPQPAIGQFWCKIQDFTHGTVPKVRLHYETQRCAHCRNAACMAVCEAGAIYRREDGLILIDPDKCTGCRLCMDACPYNAIYYNAELNIAQKCTGCAHLLDNGYTQPRCVEACPTEALKFGEEEDMQELIARSEIKKPELGMKPRLYYLNIPKRFIGGAVYDPIEEEVVTGAVCTLTGEGAERKTVTDDFGDFWFRELPKGKYSLIIEAEGFKLYSVSEISTEEKDINLGDIALEK